MALLEHQEILPRQEFMRLDERIAGRVEFLRHFFRQNAGGPLSESALKSTMASRPLGRGVYLSSHSHLACLYFNALGHSLSSQTGSKIAYSWPM